jgi:large subunit ribosomal protein L35
MPKIKMKTHKSGAKRYRITASGKLVRGQAGRGHLNSKKSSSRKRRLEGTVVVYSGNAKKIALELPYAKYART